MNINPISNYFIPSSILDIGAHMGAWYKQCLEKYPLAQYFLIEANPMCEQYLRQLDVNYFIGALSDVKKNVTYYVDKTDPTSTGNSLYRENTHHFRDDNVLQYEIETYTLDEILHGKAFDLIKLDVQGSEINIIKGGLNIVQSAKGVILEVSKIEYNKNAPLEDVVIDFMKSIGFDEAVELGIHKDYSSQLKRLYEKSIIDCHGCIYYRLF